MLTCPADGLWPETVHSTYNLMIPCPAGYSGNMYRTCYANGEWSDVNDSYCGRPSLRLSHAQCASSASPTAIGRSRRRSPPRRSPVRRGSTAPSIGTAATACGARSSTTAVRFRCVGNG